jgi:hypothetical protein
VLVAVLGHRGSTWPAAPTEELLEQVEKLEGQAKRRQRDNRFSLLTTVRIYTGECIIWAQNRSCSKHTRLRSPSTQLCDLVQSFRSPSFDLGLALLPPNASLSLSCCLFTCIRHIRQPSKLILLGLCECRARATALVIAEPSPSTTSQASVNLLHCWQDAGWSHGQVSISKNFCT